MRATARTPVPRSEILAAYQRSPWATLGEIGETVGCTRPTVFRAAQALVMDGKLQACRPSGAQKGTRFAAVDAQAPAGWEPHDPGAPTRRQPVSPGARKRAKRAKERRKGNLPAGHTVKMAVCQALIEQPGQTPLRLANTLGYNVDYMKRALQNLGNEGCVKRIYSGKKAPAQSYTYVFSGRFPAPPVREVGRRGKHDPDIGPYWLDRVERAYYQKPGRSQTQLAAEFGVHQTYISKICMELCRQARLVRIGKKFYPSA